MIKVFKLILVVALATLAGIWATKYHGYIMLVLADKTIKMNLVVFAFIAVALVFVLVFGVRVLKLLVSFPYQSFNWFIGLFAVNKQEKFVDLIADISLNNKRVLSKSTISNISRLSPNYLKDYILFKKMDDIANSEDIKELEKALKQLDKKSFTYSYFEVYKLYLVQKFSEAQTKISILLESKDIRFIPRTVDLAGKIALADYDDAFALKILDKYDAYLENSLEEKLIILVLKQVKDVNKLTEIYNKSDATEALSVVYIERLIEHNEVNTAEKLTKKLLNTRHISVDMLKVYVNAFNMPVSKLCDKVLDKVNHNYDSILTLLDLSVVKSDNYSFKIIYDYVERNIKEFLSESELDKYSHTLCKFYIKNGDEQGIDLSQARLVYRNN